MSRPTSCEARQQGDEMQCGRCGLTWATNDPERPACAPRIDKRAILTRATTRAIQRLDGAAPVLEQPAARLYGCHSKPRPVLGAATHLAQVGYGTVFSYSSGETSRNPIYAPVLHVMSTECRYDKSREDRRCAGCPHAGRA